MQQQQEHSLNIKPNAHKTKWSFKSQNLHWCVIRWGRAVWREWVWLAARIVRIIGSAAKSMGFPAVEGIFRPATITAELKTIY
jgi:hypothetical protein